MIQAGRNITIAGDTLHKIGIEHLFHAIRNPKLEIQNQISHLRIVRNIDKKKYETLKKQ